jgi:hypothetical protein
VKARGIKLPVSRDAHAARSIREMDPKNSFNKLTEREFKESWFCCYGVDTYHLSSLLSTLLYARFKLSATEFLAVLLREKEA